MPEHYRVERNGFVVSTDPALLDPDFVVRSLQATYWANDRTREEIVESLRHSLNFGLYAAEPWQQIGFARIVTDRVTFSWLCDVIVTEEYRGRKLGVWLVECVVAHPWVKYIRTTLGTRDAHGLYERFGFVRHERMVRPADPRG